MWTLGFVSQVDRVRLHPLFFHGPFVERAQAAGPAGHDVRLCTPLPQLPSHKLRGVYVGCPVPDLVRLFQPAIPNAEIRVVGVARPLAVSLGIVQMRQEVLACLPEISSFLPQNPHRRDGFIAPWPRWADLLTPSVPADRAGCALVRLAPPARAA